MNSKYNSSGMLDKRMKFIQVSFVVMDVLLTVATFRLALVLRNLIKGDTTSFSTEYWIMLAAVAVLWPISIMLFNVYGLGSNSRKKEKLSLTAILPKLIVAVCFAFLVCTTSLYLAKTQVISRAFLMVFFVTNLGVLLMANFVYKMSLRKLLKRTSFYRRIIVAGSPDKVKKLVKYLNKNNELFIDIIGTVHLNGYEDLSSKPKLGEFEDLPELIIKHSADDVVVTIPYEHLKEIEPYIHRCEAMGITIHLVMDVYDMKIAKTGVSSIGVIPTLTWASVSLDPWQIVAKRLIDILGGLIGLILTGVLSIFIVPAILLDSPGGVLFRQVRVGKNGRNFYIYKFRTMCNNAEALKKKLMDKNEMDDMMFKMKDDPRVTRVGKFLRKTSLDELPQFWNVLTGDMSLVGTRPPTLDEVEKYDLHHWRRLSVKPGISGMWQVSGRNEITDFEDVVKLDVQYIDSWSIWLDFSIIFKTIHAIVKRSGR
ncbi:sugar transferase [Acetobacteroides hydrogenigenes]|nr:sugar transferase [Acetobacteroides hydrogenigenes]